MHLIMNILLIAFMYSMMYLKPDDEVKTITDAFSYL